jgi:hypothetical protein
LKINFFHIHKFERRGVNHFAHNGDYVTRILQVCRCGEMTTALVPGIWNLDQVTTRNVDFDREFTKAARICSFEKEGQNQWP